MRDLQDMFRKYFELEDQISKLQREQGLIKEELREELIKSNETAIEHGGFKMQFIKSVRTTLDKKSLTAAHPRLSKQFSRQACITSFRITRPASNK